MKHSFNSSSKMENKKQTTCPICLHQLLQLHLMLPAVEHGLQHPLFLPQQTGHTWQTPVTWQKFIERTLAACQTRLEPYVQEQLLTQYLFWLAWQHRCPVNGNAAVSSEDMSILTVHLFSNPQDWISCRNECHVGSSEGWLWFLYVADSYHLFFTECSLYVCQ